MLWSTQVQAVRCQAQNHRCKSRGCQFLSGHFHGKCSCAGLCSRLERSDGNGSEEDTVSWLSHIESHFSGLGV